jgi:hypothetical protein
METKKRRSRLTETEHKLIQSLFKQNTPIPEIARELRCTPASVYSALDRAGLWKTNHHPKAKGKVKTYIHVSIDADMAELMSFDTKKKCRVIRALMRRGMRAPERPEPQLIMVPMSDAEELFDLYREASRLGMAPRHFCGNLVRLGLAEWLKIPADRRAEIDHGGEI